MSADSSSGSPVVPAEAIERILDQIGYWNRVAVGFALRVEHPDYDTDASLGSKRDAETQLSHQIELLRSVISRYLLTPEEAREAIEEITYATIRGSWGVSDALNEKLRLLADPVSRVTR